MRRTIRRSRRLRAALGGILGAGLLVGGVGVNEAEAVTFIKSDLDFILQQIKISEAHAGGAPLVGNGPLQVANPMLMYGVRTVDGTDNNIQPNQAQFGAADQVFPRLTSPLFRDAESFSLFPGAPGQPIGSPTSYTQTKGYVEDAQPRVISNLVADASSNNPAAVAAADQTPGAAPVPDGHPANPDPYFIPNRATDAGLSAPYNSWFTFFGQFFDHGLDLVNKGKSGTVLIPLKADDPLIAGKDGVLDDDPATTVDESADNLPPHLRFMALTRTTNQPGPDGIVGDNPATTDVDESADDVHDAINQTTPFVDQNQTYTSHPSHQVFLREYAPSPIDGKPVASGRLLDGAGGGLANWAEVKAQASTMLGIRLSDFDVLNVPKLATDQYGRFVRSASGFARIALPGGLFLDGDPTANGGLGVTIPANALRTGHAFLDDIAHHAAPGTFDHDGNPATPKIPQTADADPGTTDDNDPATYDDEMLGSHFATGDGRGNENIGLTTVHHVFHSEHNRLAAHVKDVVLATASTGDFAFLNQWLLTPVVDALPADPDALVWNGERIFQAAKFGTEMQYQHLVFEEFARKMQPLVNVFAGYHTEINPAIVAEFAHTVYRFGHSMLTETVPRTNPDGTPNDIGLIQAFLNPQEFTASGPNAKAAAGAIVQGTTRQVGNEIDEFVTDALRDNLLGLPLDLPTINLARGRDTGIPPLNQARKELFAATSHSALQPYTSWADFGLALRHPESLVNFIAAYGKHPNVTGATTQAGKRAAAYAIVYGLGGVDGAVGGGDDPDPALVPDDRNAFLNSTLAWGNTDAGMSITGLDDVDLWIGGLAEKPMPFGGLLGSTFNYVFETQMENLQDGDRFYYLGRLAGLNFLSELEANSFAALIARNTTGTKYLPADVFSRPDYVIEAFPENNPTWFDGTRQLASIAVPGGPLRFIGGEHIVMGGTDAADNLRANEGDDTLHGLGGDDRLEGEAGNDVLIGGDGDDVMTDTFGDDNFKGGNGNDAISVGGGIDLALAGFGDDMVVGGEDVSETFGGGGDDLIIGGQDSNTIFANEGDDWLEGGDGADLMQGGNGDPFQTDTQTGHDVIIGDGGDDDYDSEGGDDTMVTGPGIERNEGMLGFDWVTHRLDPQAARADMNFTGLMPPDIDNIRDRFDMVEGLSGWNKDDILRGDSRTEVDMGTAHSLNDVTQINRIAGLQNLLGAGVTSFTGGNIILGGGGSDLIEGRGGNDLIDGDAQLNVQLRAPNPATADPDDTKLVNSATQLQADIFARRINPGQVDIVRSIDTPTPGPADVDTAVFSDILANYQIVENPDDPTIVTVVHSAGARIDGTDTLHNIERLQFSDQTVVRTGTNPIPTGVPTISNALPTEDEVLTAGLGTVSDINGINTATIAFEWQAETDPGVWTTVGTGTTFSPDDGEVGLALRVVVSFQDGLGVFENAKSLTTAPVINVNDPATGRPAINDLTPQIDQVLTATRGSIADNDGLVDATFTFAWEQSGDGVTWSPLGTGPSSPPVPAGQMVRVIASFTDDNGTPEAQTSVATDPAPLPPPPVGPAAVATGTGLRLLTLSRLRVTQPRASLAAVSVRLTGPASVQLQVRRTNNNKLVRRIWGRINKAGVVTLRWNKRDARGKRVKPGNYRFVIIAKGAAGPQKILRKTVRIR